MNLTISMHIIPAVLAFIVGMVITTMFFLIYLMSFKFSDERSKEALSLGLLCLGSSIYLLGQILLNDNTNPDFAIFWHRFQHVGLILVAPAYITFAYLYVGRKKDWIYIFILFISVFSLLMLYTTEIFISSVPYLYMNKYLQGKEGPLYFIFGTVLVVALVYGYVLLIKKYLKDKETYNYDRIMIIGIGIAAVLGIHDIISVTGYFVFGVRTTFFEFGLTLMCVSMLYAWVIGKGFFEKHLIENSLIESRDKFNLISKNMKDIIWLFDLNLSMAFTSESSEKYFNMTSEKLKSKGLNSLFDKNDVAKFKEYFTKIKNSGHKEVPSELVVAKFEKDDGSCKWVEVGMSPVIKNKITIGVVAILRDISERKHLEEELMQSQKLQAVGQLAAGVSHEFNNLLSVIILNIQVAKNRDTIEMYRKAGTTILEASRQAEVVARRLNEFARKHKLECRPTNLAACVDETIALIGKECEANDIDLIKEYANDFRLVTDGRMLIQVLFNISKNAEQAIGNKGFIKYSIKKSKDWFEIWVSDSGKGIKKENLTKIFDPFFTTKGAYGDGKIKGSGLGLSVSYSIMLSLGGKILVESEEGRGATFKICLPVRGLKECDEEKGPEVKEKPGFTVKKILIVDDETEITSALKEMIESLGHRCYVANNSPDALKQTARIFPDIIMLDMVMPNTDILVLIKKISKYVPPEKIVMATGIGASELEKWKTKLEKLGVKKQLLKPFYLEDLKILIASATNLDV